MCELCRLRGCNVISNDLESEITCVAQPISVAFFTIKLDLKKRF